MDTTPAGRLPRRLLAALTAAAPSPVSVADLIDAAWDGCPPSTVESSLRTHLSVVRRALGGSLESGHRTYWLSDPSIVDLVRFRELTSSAFRHADTTEEFDTLGRALALWKGRPWGELADEPWFADRAAELEEHRCVVEDRWAELAGELELDVDNLRHLRELARAQPIREQRWVSLVRALTRADRSSEALQAFDVARRSLAEQIGVTPGAALLAAYDDLFAAGAAPSGASSPPLRPPPGAIVGRAAEIEAIGGRLAEGWIVTVTGLGGVGKTRVVWEVIQQAHRRGQRAWLLDVPTAELRPRVLRELAAQIGIVAPTEAEALDGLKRRLVDVDMLALDGAERCAEEIGILVEALRRARPRCALLVSSRRPLSCADEFAVSIGPLAVPTLGQPWTDTAVELLARLRGVDPARDPDLLPDLVADCVSTAGIPLLIEISTRSGPSVSGGPVDERVSLTTIELVHELEGATRAIAEAMAVLPGGVDTGLAMRLIGGSNREAARRIQHLSWLGLARATTMTGVRSYHLPETVGDAVARMLDEPQIATIRRQLVDHLIGLGLEIRPTPADALDAGRFADLDAHRSNLTAVLDHQYPGWAEVASVTADYLGTRGYSTQMARWMSTALDADDPVVRAGAALTVARTGRLGAHVIDHLDELEKAAATFRSAGDPIRSQLATLHVVVGLSFDQRVADADATLTATWPDPTGSHLMMQYFEMARGWLTFLQGDYQTGLATIAAVASGLEEIDLVGASLAQYLLVNCAQIDPSRASALLRHAYEVAGAIDDKPMLAGIAYVEASLHGPSASAIRPLEKSAAMFDAGGMPERAAIARLRAGEIQLTLGRTAAARHNLAAAVEPLIRAGSASARIALARLAASYRDENLDAARRFAAAIRHPGSNTRGYAMPELVNIEVDRLTADLDDDAAPPTADELSELLGAIFETR